ncbi:MAG: hypothetical protein R3C10_08965 [Pirellulales bacterium]
MDTSIPDADHPHTADPGAANAHGRPASAGQALLEVLLIFCVFFIHASRPVPDTNEPHYLSRAVHYWNAEWCSGDVFLATPVAHRVFYIAFGWATRQLTLDEFAWAGRLFTWLLLSIAWYALVRAIVSRPWYAVLAAALFVFTNQLCQPAGEWVVGGFEAKGIAYAAVFAALAAATTRRWNVAAVLLGVATAFHVLVGGWAALAVGVVALTLGEARPRVMATLPGLLAAAALAACGIWPALELSRAAPAEIAATASDIYVFGRLQHHLVLQYFQTPHLVRYALLLVGWLVLNRCTRETATLLVLRRFVWCALGISAVGAFICLAWPLFGREGAAAAVALLLVQARRCHAVGQPPSRLSAGLLRGWLSGGPGASCTLLAAIIVATVHLGGHMRARVTGMPPRGEAPLSGRRLDDWRDACAWAGARIATSRRGSSPRVGRKRFAGTPLAARSATGRTFRRAPPKSSPGARMDDLYRDESSRRLRWLESLSLASPARLAHLAETYEAPYLVTDARPELPFLRLYSNDSFAVYDLTRPTGPLDLPGEAVNSQTEPRSATNTPNNPDETDMPLE